LPAGWLQAARANMIIRIRIFFMNKILGAKVRTRIEGECWG
jgi:hypothetical protein